MKSRTKRVVALGFVLFTSGALLSGCGNGLPTESDYVEACVTKPQAVELQCECAAREARSKLTDNAWKAFVLDEQGKSEEASDITGKLSIAEQSALVGAGITIDETCGG